MSLFCLECGKVKLLIVNEVYNGNNRTTVELQTENFTILALFLGTATEIWLSVKEDLLSSAIK